MEQKYYWLAYWLERYSDETLKAFKTAVYCETMARAVTIAAEVIRARANEKPGTQCMMYSIGLADKGAAELLGKTEPDRIGIDWPEEETGC